MTAMTLQEYVQAVTDLVDGDATVPELVDAIAPLKARLLATPDLFRADFHEGLQQAPYTRNLLHADPEGRFTVIAIVWGAGRGSPVHDHESWGVVGGYGETITVVDFDAADGIDGPLVEKPKKSLMPGQVAKILPPRLLNIHKMQNDGARPAFSIHTYGDPAKACRVYDPKTGRTTSRELQFHHVL